MPTSHFAPAIEAAVDADVDGYPAFSGKWFTRVSHFFALNALFAHPHPFGKPKGYPLGKPKGCPVDGSVDGYAVVSRSFAETSAEVIQIQPSLGSRDKSGKTGRFARPVKQRFSAGAHA